MHNDQPAKSEKLEQICLDSAHESFEIFTNFHSSNSYANSIANSRLKVESQSIFPIYFSLTLISRHSANTSVNSFDWNERAEFVFSFLKRIYLC